ncbi:hypothetical protein MLD38_008163 [Melastoma candidum]|uniref:Uncharacterized protein n=1 Tax=Melastoma candidum TaxID=119954 RepID=A0ACB9RTD6_9MYRT|nr:hypothetical protein MLD38_008163 [Melastoma candidum]
MDVQDYMMDSAVEMKFTRGNMSTSIDWSRGVRGAFSSENEYPLDPWALQLLLEYVKQNYGNPPIYIHENGMSSPRNATLEDWPRVQLLQSYIGSLLDGIRNGSDVRGYFVWSFLDVFEILSGFKTGFGLYYVDLDDPELTRYPKRSAHWYSQFLKGGASVRPESFLRLMKNHPSSSPSAAVYKQ